MTFGKAEARSFSDGQKDQMLERGLCRKEVDVGGEGRRGQQGLVWGSGTRRERTLRAYLEF